MNPTQPLQPDTPPDTADTADRLAAARHEPAGVSTGSILLFTGALILTLIVAGLAVWSLFDLFAALQSQPKGISTALTPLPAQPPQPQLQVHEPMDLTTFQQHEAQRLDAYGWIDRDKGVAHIPIDRAMQLYLAQHAQNRAPDAGHDSKEQP